MDVTSITTATTTAASSTSDSAIVSDYTTFLKMLTVQAQNQDPLNPTDSSEYAVQLATFSMVEQQTKTNDLLTAYIEQIATTGLSDLAGLVGQDVRAPVSAYFDGSPVTVAPNPLSDADSVELVVENESGIEVDRITLPVSDDTVEWAGVDSSGNPLPSGKYNFYVVSYQDGEAVLAEQSDVYAKVTEVRTEDGTLMLVLESGDTVEASTVTGLRGA